MAAARSREAWYREVVSGEASGVVAALARGGLSLLTPFYTLAVRLRNAAFDFGCLKTNAVGVPVISVGNLTVGGTGKTPIVAEIARRLQEQGVPPGIVSRGYRAAPGALNDEGEVLTRLVPEAALIQSPDRSAAARQAILSGSGCIIMDDGLQHRRLQRDLDIVVVDATLPFGYDRLLPRGLLREPLGALGRCDLAIITRSELVDPAEIDAIEARIRRENARLPIIRSRFVPKGLVTAAGVKAELNRVIGQRVLAVCGIGNPEAFRQTLVNLGADAVLRRYPDHHHYSAEDLDAMQQAAAEAEASMIVVTLKDLVKFPRARDQQSPAEGSEVPIWGLEIGVQFEGNGSGVLEQMLQRVVTVRR